MADAKYEAQAIKKKVSGVRVSGDGGDVESLDDLATEDAEAVDSEWTQGGADDGEVIGHTTTSVADDSGMRLLCK